MLHAILHHRKLHRVVQNPTGRNIYRFFRNPRLRDETSTVGALRSHPFLHRSLNVGEPVAIDGRSVGRKGIGGEAGWLGLAEVVVCPRYQRGQIRCSVGIVGRLRLGAPLAEPCEQLLLGGRSYSVTRGIDAIACDQERNTRLVLGLIGGLGCFRYQLAVKDRRRLVILNAGRSGYGRFAGSLCGV